MMSLSKELPKFRWLICQHSTHLRIIEFPQCPMLFVPQELLEGATP